MQALITSPIAVLATLVAVAAFFFWLEEKTKWKMWNYLPPLLWIYALPIALSNISFQVPTDAARDEAPKAITLLPHASEAYDLLKVYGLPVFIVLMLLRVDIASAIRIMGKGVIVMLIGSAGVVVGGVVSYGIVASKLPPDAWKAFGTLSGSWIGGTGNMNAAFAGLEGESQHMTMAALADNLVYIVWLPVLLGCKAFATAFNKWARVPEGRVAQMDEAAAEAAVVETPPTMPQLLYLSVLACGATAVSFYLADVLPVIEVGGAVVVSRSTWVVLLVTTCGLLLSMTRASKLPGSQPIAMALIYVFVAHIGAKVDIGSTDFGAIAWFVVAAYIWIAIHGIFTLVGAFIFRIDVHTLAIASAANVGGAASAPVVAAHHRKSLVPASILMALIGYAIGNYLAIATGRLCQYFFAP